MKLRSVTPMKIAKYGYIAISAIFTLAGLAMIFYPTPSQSFIGIFFGIAILVFGIIKLVGYWSRDLFRLAFQYDLQFGVLLCVLGIITLIRHKDAVAFLCVAYGICIMADSLFKIRTALDAKAFGIRSCLCYEVSDRDGEEKCDLAIRENGDFIRHCAREKNPMISAMFGGHALFTISDRTFEKMVKENNGMTGFHIHVSEGMNDVYDTAYNYGTRSVNRLLNNGILGPKTMLGHCIHVNPAEMDIIRETGTMVCNNPESNMGNAVGCAPVLQMIKKGITVGLGTDSYTFDMLESLKVALIIQRHNACMPNVAWCEVTDMLFKNNAKIGAKYFPDQLGVLKAGAAADIIVMDYKPFTPFSDANIDGHMIFGMTGRQCQTTIAAGKVLMKDRVLVNIDEEAENAHILEAAKKLWGDLNHRVY